MNYINEIRNHVAGSIETKNKILNDKEFLNKLDDAANIIANAFKNGGKLMLCGNGGSAADSQHIAAEFTSVLSQDVPRPGLPAIALTTDTSFLTANANDYGFEGGFERAVQALGISGDVLIGITTSGNSKNVIRAFEQARQKGITTISWTGETGGRIKELSDICINVPSKIVQFIQESHIMVGHIICDLVERKLGYRD